MSQRKGTVCHQLKAVHLVMAHKVLHILHAPLFAAACKEYKIMTESQALLFFLQIPQRVQCAGGRSLIVLDSSSDQKTVFLAHLIGREGPAVSRRHYVQMVPDRDRIFPIDVRAQSHAGKVVFIIGRCKAV